MGWLPPGHEHVHDVDRARSAERLRVVVVERTEHPGAGVVGLGDPAQIYDEAVAAIRA